MKSACHTVLGKGSSHLCALVEQWVLYVYMKCRMSVCTGDGIVVQESRWCLRTGCCVACRLDQGSGMSIYRVISGVYYGLILKAEMYFQLKSACVVVTVFKTVIRVLIPTLNTDVFFYFRYFSTFSPFLII